MFRIDEGLDPGMARLLFDIGNFGFASTWVLLGSMLLATGIVAVRTQALPGWLGWASIILAVVLLIARAIWTTQIAFLPYALYWLWLIVTSILLIRRAETLSLLH